MSSTAGGYYVPKPSHWPIMACIALICLTTGAANWIHGNTIGPYLFSFGFLVLIFMKLGWFRTVINEGLNDTFNHQVELSFRWGMGWFIFSEVCFFSAFFGALFYTRAIVVPWLGGDYGTAASLHTNLVLWPNFHGVWPVMNPPGKSVFHGLTEAMSAWGIATINTAVLLTSGLTITWAHWAIVKSRRKQVVISMLITVALGIAFLALQSHEYWRAYNLQGLTLGSGIYGTTFFMLTGFHGLHVTIGTIMLIIITIRCMKGHFDKDHLFGFEAVSWYWHFVDVVWLLLFIFVYWM